MQPSSPCAPRPTMLLNRSIRATIAAAAVAAVSILAPSSGPLTSLPSAAAATTRSAATAGAATVGAARYAVPAGAVFASPKGSDSNPGTVASPVKTITRALAVVGTG